MNNFEREDPASAETTHPSLGDMLKHNQREWRARSKGWKVFSSPIEVHASKWFIGQGAEQVVTNAFGSYLHPAYRENPPLIGVSVFNDFSVIEQNAIYWSIESGRTKKIDIFNEAKVRWLTYVALKKNPLKPSLLDRSVTPSRILDMYDRYLRACKNGLSADDVTHAFALSQFTGDNKELERIFPFFNPEDPKPIGEYFLPSDKEVEEQKKAEEKARDDEETPTVHLSENTIKILYPLAKTAGQLFASVVAPMVGATNALSPGIVNLIVLRDITSIGLVGMGIAVLSRYNYSNTPLLLGASLIQAVAIVEIGNLVDFRNTLVHELIHAQGMIDTHEQGFPGTWKKEPFVKL